MGEAPQANEWWICKKCTGLKVHYLTCPVLRLPALGVEPDEEGGRE
jgi:hypothetical protein